MVAELPPHFEQGLGRRLEQSLSDPSLQRKAKSQAATLVTDHMFYPIDTSIDAGTDEWLVTISWPWQGLMY
jgi:hypothetical protein